MKKILLLLTLNHCFTLVPIHSQEKLSSAGIPEISAGGEYNLMLQKAIREG